MDMEGRGTRMSWEIRTDIYTLQWEAAVGHRELSSVLCDGFDGSEVTGRRKVHERGDTSIYIHTYM